MIITLKAKSPIAHGAFTDGIGMGNVAEFRKIPVVHKGEVYNIPTISGNAVRGIIRRNLVREFFEMNKLNEKLETKEFDKLYAVLGNGGALSNGLDSSIDCNYLRDLRKQLPILSVLGGACYKFMLNGMCNIGFFKLKCTELGNGDKSIATMITEIGETRHIDKNVINTESAGITPMPYTTEAIIEGSEFEGAITFAPMATEIEISCLNHGIRSINHVGGKSGRGYGMVSVIPDSELDDELYYDNVTNIDIDFIKDFIRSIS